MYVDFFNQPITEKSKLLVAISGRLKLCNVVKFNKKTIVVVESDYKNGTPMRIIPENAAVLSSEDLTVLALRKGI